jgi:3-hydroxyisobutyrate dehydrogenase
MSTATIIALAVACVLLVILLVLVARAARSRRLEQRRRSAGELRRVINSWLVTVVEGAAETIALAESAGVDPHQFLQALSGGPLDRPYLQLKGKAMIDRELEPSFRLALASKDADRASELSRSHGLALPLIETISERFSQGARANGEKDVAAACLTSAPPLRRAG